MLKSHQHYAEYKEKLRQKMLSLNHTNYVNCASAIYHASGANYIVSPVAANILATIPRLFECQAKLVLGQVGTSHRAKVSAIHSVYCV